MEQSLERLGIESLDSEELAAICQRVIEENPDIIQQIRNGNDKAIGNLIGKTKIINRNVEPGLVRKQILTFIKNG